MPNAKGWYTKQEVLETGLPYWVNGNRGWIGENGELQEMKISWWDEQRHLIGWLIGDKWRRFVARITRRR